MLDGQLVIANHPLIALETPTRNLRNSSRRYEIWKVESYLAPWRASIIFLFFCCCNITVFRFCIKLVQTCPCWHGAIIGRHKLLDARKTNIKYSKYWQILQEITFLYIDKLGCSLCIISHSLSKYNVTEETKMWSQNRWGDSYRLSYRVFFLTGPPCSVPKRK